MIKSALTHIADLLGYFGCSWNKIIVTNRNRKGLKDNGLRVVNGRKINSNYRATEWSQVSNKHQRKLRIHLMPFVFGSIDDCDEG